MVTPTRSNPALVGDLCLLREMEEPDKVVGQDKEARGDEGRGRQRDQRPGFGEILL